jgi:hypothetical protein
MKGHRAGLSAACGWIQIPSGAKARDCQGRRASGLKPRPNKALAFGRGFIAGGFIARNDITGGVGLFRRDAQRLEEGKIVAREGATFKGDSGVFAVLCILGFFIDFVEADRSFEHEQDVETLFAYLTDDAGNLIGLAHRFVDRFAQLLDEVFDLLIQSQPPIVFGIQTCVGRFQLHALGIPCWTFGERQLRVCLVP